MAIIPNQNRVQSAVENDSILDPQREYIGLSGIGHPCQRKIWYDFRHCYTPIRTSRELRIFERGDIEEPRVIRDLQAAGMEISSEQFPLVDNSGHIRGHIDGIVTKVPGAEKTPHLLEIKTMNQSRYNDYIKKGIKQSAFGYYVQMNQYMGYLHLTRCLFVVTNKNNEERNYQRYEFDKENFEEFKRIAFGVLTSENPPPRIGESFYLECKLCNAKNICHKGEPFQKSCRNCYYAAIEMNGAWACDKTGNTLSLEDQKVGCSEYCPLENV